MRTSPSLPDGTTDAPLVPAAETITTDVLSAAYLRRDRALAARIAWTHLTTATAQRKEKEQHQGLRRHIGLAACAVRARANEGDGRQVHDREEMDGMILAIREGIDSIVRQVVMRRRRLLRLLRQQSSASAV
jgi:hypothetical protein